MKRLVVREWGHLHIGDGNDKVTRAEGDALLAVARVAAKDLRKGEDQVLQDGRRSLRASQTVGILAAPGVSLEILPKVGSLNDPAIRRNLVRMIAEVEGFPLSAEESAQLERQNRDLLELLIGLFARRLLDALRPGLARAYLTEEDDVRSLRGRLRPERQFARLAGRADVLACRFDELSPDTPLNRILRAAALHLWERTRVAASARMFGEALLHLEGVPDLRGPLPTVHLDRTNAHFRALHAQARLILLGRHQSTTGGAQVGQAILFRMNDLFEAWVARALRHRLTSEGWTVTLQGPQRDALTRNGAGVFRMKPDIVLDSAGGLRVVVDTKWKRLDPLATDSRRGVAQGDVYQLMAYARAYEAQAVMLLYPSATGLLALDRLRIGGTGPSFALAELPLEDLRAVPDLLALLIETASETALALSA